jgi:hypothetical protein
MGGAAPANNSAEAKIVSSALRKRDTEFLAIDMDENQ